MSRNPDRITCRCGKGKVSAWDGKCGHCRNKHEQEAVNRMRKGWPKEAALRGYLTHDEKLLRSFDDVSVDPPPDRVRRAS